MTPSSVLVVTPRWVRDGGVGAHVKASVEVLAAHGLNVEVIVGRIESDERVPGVKVYCGRELFKPNVSLEVRLGELREALSSQPQLVHLQQLDVPELVDALRASAPVVISAHGYIACTSGVHYFRPGHECTRAHGSGCVPNLLRCAHTRDPRWLPGAYRQATRGLDALRRADLVVSYSSAVDRHLRANDVARRTVVPYFPTTATAPERAPEPARRVVFAGRVVAPKGVGVLIRAARRVDAEFVICGDGTALEDMRRLAARLGVCDRVRFTGWLDADELAAELACAAVLVLPSLWPEPFGIVGIEAFAVGRPAIATDTGGVGDWLEPEVSGLFVKPGDVADLVRALERLLADPVLRDAMGEAGRASVAARFSRSRHLDAILDAYGRAHANWQAERRGGALGLAA